MISKSTFCINAGARRSHTPARSFSLAMTIAPLLWWFSVTAAKASQWFLWEAGPRQCIDASYNPFPQFSTPYRAEEYARMRGIYIRTDIKRDAGGKIAIVGVTYQFPSEAPLTMYYFRDLYACRAMTSVMGGPSELD